MAQINSELMAAARAKSTATFRVIVRVEGDMDARRAQLESDGLTISRRLSLIHGFAATATGAWIQQAADKPWILSVERDAEIKAVQDKTN